MIFLGAGASTPFGIPTTPLLTMETVNLLNTKNQSLLEKITQAHAEQWQKREPNYEEILGYLTAYTNPAELRNDDYRLSFPNKNPQFANGNINDLIEEIYEIVCKHCNSPFIKGTDNYLPPEELEYKFQNTYDTLLGNYLLHEKQPVVFSTNYDPSLELWCLKRNLACIDGTKRVQNIEVNKILDENKHKEAIQNIKRVDTNTVGLVRLHGSIWAYEINENLRIKFTTPPDIRMFPDVYQKRLKTKPCLIFPGQEDHVSRGRWDILYQYFKEMLSGNCLFIGFSLRHDVFRGPILDNLRSGKIRNLGILSLDASNIVKDLVKSEKRFSDRIVTMDTEFGGRDAIEQLAHKWFHRIEGFGASSGYNLIEEVNHWKTKREIIYL